MKYTFNEEREFDIVAIGRACIDLNAAEYNRPMEETMTFSKYVGGSPANIAIGSAKLGLKTGFIGKIPDDQHGRFIVSYMKEKGVDTSQMVVDRDGHKAFRKRRPRNEQHFRVCDIAFKQCRLPMKSSN